MKKHSFIVTLLIGTLFLLNGQSSALDNPGLYANLLTVNGHTVDYNNLWYMGKGVLTLVDSDPKATSRKPVLFRVLLRRAGTVVKQWPANKPEGMYSIQLEELWLDARLGDELIVEPVDTSTPQPVENPGRRVIKLRGPNWLSHCLPADNC